MIGSCQIIVAGLLYSTSVAAAAGQTATAADDAVQQRDQPDEAIGERPAAATPAENSGVEDIVVTATRREERLQNVPVAVSAVTSQTMESSGVTNVRELTTVVPGFFGGRNFALFSPTIRGVGSSGTHALDEPNVATYIDGVYMPSPYANFIDLAEVERVEVLKGPQGTVFGRNATGGLINVITPDPSFDFRGNSSARVGLVEGSDVAAHFVELKGYVTGPLSKTIAADLSSVFRSTGHYIRNLAGPRDFGGNTIGDVRAKLLFQPTDRIEIMLTGERFEQDSAVNAQQPINGNTIGASRGAIIPDEPWEASLDTRPRIDVVRNNGALHTRLELKHFNVETTTGYYRSKTSQDADSDASNLPFGSLSISGLKGSTPTVTRSWSNELRLLSTGSDSFTWILGAYAFHNKKEGITYLEGNTIAPTGTITATSRTHSGDIQKATSYAGFAEATAEVVDRLFLTLGGRYTTEKREIVPSLRVNGVQVPRQPAEGEFDKFTYRGALRYQFNPDAMVYASYGTGFKSGVFGGSVVQVLLRPETLKAAEMGFKVDPLPWLRTNAALYHYIYDDLQVTARDPNSTGFIFQNAGTAKIYGGELELFAVPTSNLNIRGSVAYNHAKYTDFPAAQVFTPRAGGGNTGSQADVSGNRLSRAPEWTANLGFDWTTDMQGGALGLAGNIFYSSRVYFDFANIISQKPYTTISGQAWWETPDRKLRFSLWGRNLTNGAIYQQGRINALAADALYEEPRTFGVGVSTRF